MDEAALDFRGRPALSNRAESSLATVDDSNQWRFDAFEKSLIIAGGFVFAPVPGDDVIKCCCHDQAAGGGVGAVEEDLVVDPACMSDGGIWDVDEPAPAKPAFHRGMTDAVALCYCFYRRCRGAVVDELVKHCSVSDIASAFDAGCATDLASPSDCSFSGGPVTFHLAAAVAAWSVL